MSWRGGKLIKHTHNKNKEQISRMAFKGIVHIVDNKAEYVLLGSP